MSGEHAILAPSSAARMVQCSGSVTLEPLYPTADSDQSIEGTLAHTVCAALLQGAPAPAGATEEMLDGAEMYVDAIHTYVDNGMPLLVEAKVSCPGIHNEMWGTPDAVAIDRKHKVVYIWDYKFGHSHVEVFENWQLIAYAAGVCDLLEVGEVLTFVLTVVQPRSYHRDGPVRSWTIKTEDLTAYWIKLSMRAKVAMLPAPVTTTGGECNYCSARHACPTLQSAAYSAAQMSGVSVPFDLPTDALGRELAVLTDAAANLKARIAGLENEVLGKIKMGATVPLWMTEQGSGREKWARPIEEILALGDMMGVNISKPGAITPKQAVKAGLPKEVVSGYTETPAGALTLVRANTAKFFQGA